MTRDEVIAFSKTLKRSEIAKATGLPYMWLYEIQRGRIKNPGVDYFDRLRAHVERHIQTQ